MKPISLLKLSDSSVDIIVKMMEFRELVILCICSNRSAQLVKRTKPKMTKISLSFSHNQCAIYVTEKNKTNLWSDVNVVFQKKSRKKVWVDFLIIFRFDSGMQQEKYFVEDPVQSNLNLARRFKESFNVEMCRIELRMDHFESRNLRKYLKRILVNGYSHFKIYGKPYQSTAAWQLNPDEIKSVMNVVNPNAGIHIEASFPVDFNHKKTFKFKSIFYSDCRWVTLDHLKSIRNMSEVILCKTNFTSQDLHEFLQYWINCEEDMMRDMELYRNRNFPFDENIIWNQLNSKMCEFTSRSYFLEGNARFIKAENSGKRKYPLGMLGVDGESIRFITFESTGLASNILKHLDNKENTKKLEKVKVEVEQLELKYQKMLENEKCDIQKNLIQKELEVVVGSKNLIAGRLNSIRHEWKPFLLNVYSGLVPLAVSTDTELKVIVTSNE